MNNIKVHIWTLILALAWISIQLIPVSRKAAYWNRCLGQTKLMLSNVDDLSKYSIKYKDAPLVSICNGAMYRSDVK